MKYRRLSSNELQELQNEFVSFLAANTITAADWERIKQEEPDKAERLIEMFSDIVFDKTLERIDFLEHKTPRELRTFSVEENKIKMLGLRVEGSTDLDFTRNDSPEQMLGQLKLSGAELKMYSGEKNVADNKKLELFKLMQKGALISRDGQMYKALRTLLQD